MIMQCNPSKDGYHVLKFETSSTNCPWVTDAQTKSVTAIPGLLQIVKEFKQNIFQNWYTLRKEKKSTKQTMVTVVSVFYLNVMHMVRFRCFVYSNGLALKEAYVTLQLMNDLCKHTTLPLYTKTHTSQWMSLPDSCYAVTVAMVSWWMAQICDLWLLFCAQSPCKHHKPNTVHTQTHTHTYELFTAHLRHIWINLCIMSTSYKAEL